MTHTLISHLPYKGRMGGVLIMYFKPAMKIEEAQVANMLAESLVIDNTTTVDGSQALTKEDNWNIWSDNEE